jgi:hypothetical protein
MEEAMRDLNAALEPFGLTATFTPDPDQPNWGRIDFAGETAKHRMGLHYGGASCDRASKKWYRDQHISNLRDFAEKLPASLAKMRDED